MQNFKELISPVEMMQSGLRSCAERQMLSRDQLNLREHRSETITSKSPYDNMSLDEFIDSRVIEILDDVLSLALFGRTCDVKIHAERAPRFRKDKPERAHVEHRICRSSINSSFLYDAMVKRLILGFKFHDLQLRFKLIAALTDLGYVPINWTRETSTNFFFFAVDF